MRGRKKGVEKTAGSGRKKGSPNKCTKQLKEMVLEALNGVGGIDYLKKQANEEPKAFLMLLSRIIPLQVTTPPDQPFVIKNIPSMTDKEFFEFRSKLMK